MAPRKRQSTKQPETATAEPQPAAKRPRAKAANEPLAVAEPGPDRLVVNAEYNITLLQALGKMKEHDVFSGIQEATYLHHVIPVIIGAMLALGGRQWSAVGILDIYIMAVHI